MFGMVVSQVSNQGSFRIIRVYDSSIPVAGVSIYIKGTCHFTTKM